MGDVDAPESDNVVNNPSCEEPKASIDILRGVKPSENIPAVIDNADTEKPPSIEKEEIDKTPVKIETVFKNSQPNDSSSEKIGKKESTPENTEIKSDTGAQLLADKSPPAKNRSDIFSLNDTNQMAATIFSVTGAPSRKPQQIKAIISNLNTPESLTSTETITTQMSTSSRCSTYRNPVTGIGVNSNDEFRSKPSGRRDGNPISGLGYKEQKGNVQNPNRIPPGGRSQGLW